MKDENDSPCEECTTQGSRVCVENEIFGRGSVTLRNISGTVAALTTSIIALFNVYTTHLSVKSGGGFPSELSLLIIYSPPAIIAWSYMKTNKLVELLVGKSGGVGEIRNKIADIIATDNRNRNVRS